MNLTWNYLLIYFLLSPIGIPFPSAHVERDIVLNAKDIWFSFWIESDDLPKNLSVCLSICLSVRWSDRYIIQIAKPSKLTLIATASEMTCLSQGGGADSFPL